MRREVREYDELGGFPTQIQRERYVLESPD